MDHSTRTLLMTGATVLAALSLTVAAVSAQDDATVSEETTTMAPMDEMEAGLVVRDAWTRESPMVDLAGAAYMVIHNGSDADDALVAVSSPVAEFVELHLSAMDDEGMMSMNQVAEIPIPAHADAVLEPGGYHVMLIGLGEPLTEGVEVPLELEFMTAEPQTVTAPVLASAPMTEGMDTGGEMDMGGDADEHVMEDGSMSGSDETEEDEG